jgi:NitT/TauT family transport system ATP-binding protein
MTMPAQAQTQTLSADGTAVHLGRVNHAFAASDGSSVLALRDVSLTVGVQEFVSIVGPSGCGKSTLLRILAGLVTPLSGQVSVLGEPVGARRKDVALVFQRPALLPWLNVLNNVLFPLRHMSRHVGPAEIDRAMALLAMMGMADFARLRPKELSGGMQQRVGICRALITEPRLLLMDEPFAALDALTREELGAELLRVCTTAPKAVVFVTHSIPEAVMLGDRVVVMSNRPGRIRRDCPVPLGRPRNGDVIRDAAFVEICSEVRDAIS